MAKPSEMHVAARAGDAAKLGALIADGLRPKIVNAPDQHSRTPLHLAAFFGHAAAVKVLLDGKADIDCKAMDNFLALHFAAQGGHLEALRILVDKAREGGDQAARKHLDSVVKKGKKSAIHLALAKGHLDCARCLAAAGASLELKTGQGQTAIDLCPSDELRSELRAAATQASGTVAASVPAAASAPEPTPAKRRKVATDGPVRPDSEAVVLRRTKRLRNDALAEAVAGRPLVAGPLPLDRVTVDVLGGERSYPAGTTNMAEVHWKSAQAEEPGLIDGPVWCLMSHEAVGAGSSASLRLSFQRSNYKLLHYTHFSDEGSLMEMETRCNAAGVTVMAETSDGAWVLGRGGADEPWSPVGGGSLLTTERAPSLAEVVRQLLAEARLEAAGGAEGAAAVMAVLDMGEEAELGHRHEFLVRVRLKATGSELCAARGRDGLTLVRLGDKSAPGDAPGSLSVADALQSLPLATGARAALLLLRSRAGNAAA